MKAGRGTTGLGVFDVAILVLAVIFAVSIIIEEIDRVRPLTQAEAVGALLNPVHLRPVGHACEGARSSSSWGKGHLCPREEFGKLVEERPIRQGRLWGTQNDHRMNYDG